MPANSTKLNLQKQCYATRTDEEFMGRLEKKGLLHNTVKRHYSIVKSILRDIEETDVAPVRVWQFLSVLQIISFDLNTTTKQTESQILSLLALSIGGSNSIESARITWNELLTEVSEGKPNAKSYRREDLSQAILERHNVIKNDEQVALQRLSEHSQLIFEGIRTSIGTGEDEIQLSRDHATALASTKLAFCDVLLLSGPAGIGKSGVAKQLASTLSKDSITFAFRAEEFAAPHFDQTLQNAQCGINSVLLGSMLSSQSKKTVFVESVERLLEATTREAFSDLLTLAKRDSTWKLVLTCRDYSIDIVRSSLLQLSGLTSDVMEVPLLSDNELKDVAKACPHVEQPLAHSELRELLRNPYMLDKATQMAWSPEVPLPENERAFRDKFWSEIIRRDDQAADGMPRKRQQAFTEVAVRRAKAMTMYVARDGIVEPAIERLIQDSLLSRSERTDSLVAPAHDVLEDWAIIKWIEEQFTMAGNSMLTFSIAIGVFPAIRRSYRKWLEELGAPNIDSAKPLFAQALTNDELSPQFRDDTIVAFLKSKQPNELLDQHAVQLFENEKLLLKNVIHLLRVSCMTAQDWSAGLEIEFDVPAGKAWACILRLIGRRLDSFVDSDAGLLLGLIEDASKSACWQTPYPEGAEEMVAIAHWLLPYFDNYSSEKRLKRTLKIVAKFPKCYEEAFRELLAKGGRNSEEKNLVACELRELVLSGHEGDAACRDIPDAIIEAHRESYLLTEVHLRESHFGYSSESEPTFGIQGHASFGFFPPSAFQGPFYFLLRHSYVVGEKYLTELMNHCACWFGEQRISMNYVDAPEKIQLEFDDGAIVEQWASQRLWCLYRATSVGPYLLQAALMALEKRLFDIVKLLPDDLDNLLIRLMKSSKNGAVTAVAASVATAYPHQCPGTLKVLLRSAPSVLLDRSRMAHERQIPSSFRSMMPSLGGNQLHDGERRAANELPHRSKDIENAIMNLQLGTHAKSVHEILDQHLAEIPTEAERTDEDRMWLLALRRMDIRQYEVSKEQQSSDELAGEEGAGQIRLDLKITDTDVQVMSEEAKTHHEKMEERLDLELWGMKVFKRESATGFDPSHWKQKLNAAQQAPADTGSDYVGCKGSVWVACVCVRDHLEELSQTELEWCVNSICEAIESTANNWSRMDRMQKSLMAADRPAAWIISHLLNRDRLEEQQDQVKKTMALALTHPIDDVKDEAVRGIAENLWNRHPQLGRTCMNLMVHQAVEVQKAWALEQKKPFSEGKELNEIEYHAAIKGRTLLFADAELSPYAELDVTDWIGSEANVHILLLLGKSPEATETVEAFKRLACVLVKWWDEDDQRNYKEGRISRSQKATFNLPYLLENFVLRIESPKTISILDPILEAIDRHPKHVAEILQGIVRAEDSDPSVSNFWPLWKAFADRISDAKWLPHIDGEYADGSELMHAVFLTRYWKTEIRHWKGLNKGDGGSHAHNVSKLFIDLPATSVLVECYCSFLYHIGESCLPAAFKVVAEKLRGENADNLLSRSNTVFYLETLLRRYVYGRPFELKRDPSLRDSVTVLLETLIANGSSSAYRMRDDFVTPLPVDSY